MELNNVYEVYEGFEVYDVCEGFEVADPLLWLKQELSPFESKKKQGRIYIEIDTALVDRIHQFDACGKLNVCRKEIYHYDVRFSEDGVELVVHPDGFFSSKPKRIELNLFERFYDVERGCFYCYDNCIKLCMNRKEEYPDYRSIESIFSRSVKEIDPKIEQSSYKVMSPSASEKYLITYINNEKKKMILAKPIAEDESKYYLGYEFMKNRFDRYKNKRCFSIAATKEEMMRIVKNLFPDGYFIYPENISKGYIFVNESTCDFCGCITRSHIDDIAERELCPECAAHMSELRGYVRESGSVVHIRKIK